jgi:hypothetical protein
MTGACSPRGMRLEMSRNTRVAYLPRPVSVTRPCPVGGSILLPFDLPNRQQQTGN